MKIGEYQTTGESVQILSKSEVRSTMIVVMKGHFPQNPAIIFWSPKQLKAWHGHLNK